MQELEKILEEIDETIERYGENPELITEDITNFCYGLNVAKGIIRKHMNDGWIPAEERLPEKFSIGVEVTTKDLERNIARYAKPPMDMWISVYTGRNLDVIAWKEPSEPYRPERSDNHDGE